MWSKNVVEERGEDGANILWLFSECWVTFIEKIPYLDDDIFLLFDTAL